MYIAIVGTFFAAMTIVFTCFPRSSYSVLEKRDLKEKPNPEDYTDKPGQYTAEVSSWFSDTEPYRDELMTMSMGIRGAMKGDFLQSDEEAVSFRPAETGLSNEDKESVDEEAEAHEDEPSSGEKTAEDNGEAPGGPSAATPEEGKAKLGSSGTIIVGKGDKVRALMAFGGTAKGGGGYVDLLNTLADEFPGKNVYAMVAPLATEYYLPAKAAKASNPQKPFIYSVRDRLSPKVKFVDVYDELSKHTDEDIYLRTDHHWAGLGGYYAAKRLAQTAGVPFKGLDAYDKHTVRNFVGSMYGYSKDISVKNAPEDFVYYTPNQVKYDAEFTSYTLNRDFQITKESKPYKSSFFKHFKDGSGNAYLTFIGSDQVYVKVKTSTPSARKLLIIKDSYGNAVPGNLFYSFGEVHVVDFRYFTHNLKTYIRDNGITDIAVCFNVFNAYSSGSAAKVKKMLTQSGGIRPASTVASKDEPKASGKGTTAEEKLDMHALPDNGQNDGTAIQAQPEEASRTQEPDSVK